MKFFGNCQLGTSNLTRNQPTLTATHFYSGYPTRRRYRGVAERHERPAPDQIHGGALRTNRAPFRLRSPLYLPLLELPEEPRSDRRVQRGGGEFSCPGRRGTGRATGVAAAGGTTPARPPRSALFKPAKAVGKGQEETAFFRNIKPSWVCLRSSNAQGRGKPRTRRPRLRPRRAGEPFVPRVRSSRADYNPSGTAHPHRGPQPDHRRHPPAEDPARAITNSPGSSPRGAPAATTASPGKSSQACPRTSRADVPPTKRPPIPTPASPISPTTVARRPQRNESSRTSARPGWNRAQPASKRTITTPCKAEQSVVPNAPPPIAWS